MAVPTESEYNFTKSLAIEFEIFDAFSIRAQVARGDFSHAAQHSRNLRPLMPSVNVASKRGSDT